MDVVRWRRVAVTGTGKKGFVTGLTSNTSLEYYGISISLTVDPILNICVVFRFLKNRVFKHNKKELFSVIHVRSRRAHVQQTRNCNANVSIVFCASKDEENKESKV